MRVNPFYGCGEPSIIILRDLDAFGHRYFLSNATPTLRQYSRSRSRCIAARRVRK
jgi:hypothetical protein